MKVSTEERAKYIEYTREIVPPGATIYEVCLHATYANLYCKLFVIQDGKLLSLHYNVSMILGYQFKDRDGARVVVIPNDGSNTITRVAEKLSRALGYEVQGLAK